MIWIQRSVMWVCCLIVLAGCMPAAKLEQPDFTGTPSPAGHHLPLILNEITPTTSFTPTATQSPSPTHTNTPTPTITPTPDPTMLPDLFIPYEYWVVVYHNPCAWGSPGTISLKVQNIGTGDAGPFVAAVFDEETGYDGLPAGDEAPLVYQFLSGPVASIQAEVDIDDQVQESQEGNNVFMVLFTPPPLCTPSPTPQP